MKKCLKYILILAFSIFLIGCTSEKNTNDVPIQLNEAENEKLNEEAKKSNEIFEREANKNSNEKLDEGANKMPTKESNGELETNEKSQENKIPASNKKKVIYLTFDDGPSYKVTNNVLNILKEKKVKGTFFLIGNQIKDREEVVKRIHAEGNSIGLHSYTHNYNKLYSSEDTVIQEMIDCRNEVKRVLGISPSVIRFPGGSHKRLSESLLKKLHENNFKVYDWNMENSDGLKAKTSPNELYTKAIKDSESKNNIILLLHCTSSNENTCTALPKIIEYYKSKGYEFKVITKETKELYAPIKNNN